MSLVSFVKIGREHRVRKAIQDSLDLIRYELPTNVKNVAIKPNLCYYWDHTTGQTTDPKFVAALVDLIHDQISPNVNISIVESDASAMKCKHVFKMLGYEKLAQQHGVTLVNLSEDETDKVEVEAGGQTFHFKVPKTIQDADLRVNVPKIKYHSFEGIRITCALKNIFGCNPYPKKFKYHRKLDEVIVALNKVMRFDLCIVDGNIVSGVQPRRLGLVMASQDPVAIDVAAAEIAGVNPRSIRHITLAHREGIGNISFAPEGVNPDYFRARYPRKGVTSKLMIKAYNLVHTVGLERRLGLE
jgi:uncharacterized protein (DUF362 family)